MASKTSMAYHAYQAKSPMNQGKVEALRALLPVWRAGLTLAMSCWTRPFVQSGVLPRWIDSKGFPDMLSQRQWDSVDRQARAALDSWIALREDEFRKTVNGSTLSPDLKHALHRINLRHAWWESVADDAMVPIWVWMQAPAHIGHGSSVTASVQSARFQAPKAWAA